MRAARLYQAWVEQRFAGDRASLKVGFYDLNSEFDTSDVGSLSLLSSHGIGPEFAQTGRNGPSIFPVTSLTMRAEYKLTDAWLVRAAALDGVPGDPAHPGRTVVKLSGSDGALLIGEVDYVAGGTKATLGYWRYTARFGEFTTVGSGLEASRSRGNDGAYLVIEQRLTRPNAGIAPDSKRGLSGFLQLGFADPRFNRIASYVGGGLVYAGLMAPAGEDRIGVTLARATFGQGYRRSSAGLGVSKAETVVELTYRRALAKWLTVQPDLQYVMNPSGGRTLADALATGVRVEIGF